MSRWFRHYAGLCRDDKLVRVALRAKQPVERVVWVWTAILESAAEINDEGKFDFDSGEASYFLRADEGDIRCICEALESAGRIHDGIVVRWADRQCPSDDSAERQRRYRERKKASSSHNVTVASPLRDRPVLERETETETEVRDADASLVGEIADFPVVEAVVGKKALRETLLSFGEQWNQLAVSFRLPTIDEIKSGSTRERHALARLREMPPAGGIGALMARIRGSPYLRGEVNGFRCTFDWIINASNYQKIMDGNYEDRKVFSIRR